MADLKHLEMITRGVEGWNAWRKSNPGVAPDLFEADLSRATLSGADLIVAKLRGTNFSLADLSGANLRGADLFEADLSGANLFEADLSGANLFEADLYNATLYNATLRGADLRGADLSSATVGLTIFGDVDLRPVKGLESIKHEAPSTIGIDTLMRSQGEIPVAFLKGAGVSDDIIDYAKSLVGRAIEYYTCFLSYASEDQAFAERLYNDLQGKGVRCWFAPKEIKPGDFYRQTIDESIRMYDKVLLVLSQHSVKSKWVEKEVERAWDKEMKAQPGAPLTLFPIRLDDTVMHTERRWAANLRRHRHIGDFTHWKDHDAYQVSLKRLLDDLQSAQGSTEV